MHTTRVSCSMSGDVLPTPYTYCSCEVGSCGCAHIISMNFTAIHVRGIINAWSSAKPAEDPLTPGEILSLFPPCVMGAQRTPCRAQYLAKRSRQGKNRLKSNVEELVTGAEDVSSGQESEESEEEGRDKAINFTKQINMWTLKMLNLESSDRPRIVSVASQDIESMKKDTKKYLREFPLDPHRLFEQDFLHEKEYGLMYEGVIPKNNNWGFYLYKTATDRQNRLTEYSRRFGVPLEMTYTISSLQMRKKMRKRSRPKSTHTNHLNRLKQHKTDRVVNKVMTKKIKNE